MTDDDEPIDLAEIRLEGPNGDFFFELQSDGGYRFRRWVERPAPPTPPNKEE